MGGSTGWVVIDLGPSQVRAYGDGAVTRQQAAVLCDGDALVFGGEASRRAGTDLGAFEPRLLDAIDDDHLILGLRAYRLMDVIRAFLRHAISRVTSSDPLGLVLVLPTAWGAVRRGVVERAADGLAVQTVTVGSAEAAVAGARAERTLMGNGPVVVVEQWPDSAVASTCIGIDRGRFAASGDDAGSVARGYVARGYVARDIGALEFGVVAGRVGGADDTMLTRLVDRVREPRNPGPVLVVPRAGWEFDRALQAARGDSTRFLDGDCVLRGARLAVGSPAIAART